MTPHPTEPPRLLLVDDEAPILRALQRALRQGLGPEVVAEAFTDGHQALARALQMPFDLVLCDLRMPLIDGPAVLRQMATLQPECVRMILTGTGDFASAQLALNELGAYRYLTKPWDGAALVAQCRAAIAHGRTRRRERDQALAWSVAQGQESPQELELRRLEALEPGITQVQWDSDGAVVIAP